MFSYTIGLNAAPRDKAGGLPLSWRPFDCISCVDQILGVNSSAWAGDISRVNPEGTVECVGGWVVVGGPTCSIVWSCCSYGPGTVINTSAKQQAVRPICFLLGGKRKQWGGVLHTVGDWHYLLERSAEAFLLLRYSAHTISQAPGPRLSHHLLHIQSFIWTADIVCRWLYESECFSFFYGEEWRSDEHFSLNWPVNISSFLSLLFLRDWQPLWLLTATQKSADSC